MTYPGATALTFSLTRKISRHDSRSPEARLDRQLLDIYLTGLQSEVEAKFRGIERFRAQMRKIDAAGGVMDRAPVRLLADTRMAQSIRTREREALGRYGPDIVAAVEGRAYPRTARMSRLTI